MSQLFEILPLLGFFIAYKMYDMYVAVVVLAVLMTIGLALLKIQKKPITHMQLLSWVLVLIFGGVTLIFRNEIFIKWKPSVLNWGFALAFLISHFVGKENFTQKIMSQAQIKVPDFVWKKLNFAWIIFFIFSGIVNIVVAYNFSTDIWVNFKLFGLVGLTLIFGLAQAFYLRKYLFKN